MKSLFDLFFAVAGLAFIGLCAGALVVGILAPIKGFCWMIGGCF